VPPPSAAVSHKLAAAFFSACCILEATIELPRIREISHRAAVGDTLAAAFSFGV
jgi:hypothetical protein